ncbi:hypothetical protein SAMN04487881_3690 [Marinobacter sp. es.048]|uniref:DUF948 domain-containing protein n=1 Tax=Marinobacter sp. es.048 TaxID=1761795 RepID=UPI000B59310B|nr:DUF948 domain-containing protein [Marinobacter sp. es.048]SNC76940.1 hypothetical protein SAMN04487881_3690 [Marinobacter sp. es.048]
MRLLVQGCLILGLCLLSSFTHAGFPPLLDGAVVHWSKTASKNCTSSGGCDPSPGSNIAEQAADYLPGCQAQHPGKQCVIQSYSDPKEVRFVSGGVTYYVWRGGARVVAQETSCAALTHEPDPITGNVGSTNEDDCSCATGWVSSGQDPGVAPFDCQIPDQQPEECYENGQIYDAENGYCVLDCPNGQLNGVCLQDTGDNADECNADSPDYKGYIGNGSTKTNLCTSNMECEGGAFGVVNGTPACIPDEYGPPTCEIESVLVLDEYGYVCGKPQDAPEPGQEPDEWWKDEEPNTDTDGDGEPDEYNRENDPTSVDKGLGKIADGLGDTNDKIDGTNQRLDKVGKGIDAVNKNLNEGLGTANQTLGQINEKLDGPESGYSTDGLGDAPTFQESTERLQTSIANNPTIQSVTTIPTIASNNTCPVWTIPSTDYWSAMTMDTHCQILNDHRGLLSMLFIAVWTIAAVFVFLRA